MPDNPVDGNEFGSGEVLVTSGNNPLVKQMLTQISVII